MNASNFVCPILHMDVTLRMVLGVNFVRKHFRFGGMFLFQPHTFNKVQWTLLCLVLCLMMLAFFANYIMFLNNMTIILWPYYTTILEEAPRSSTLALQILKYTFYRPVVFQFTESIRFSCSFPLACINLLSLLNLS